MKGFTLIELVVAVALMGMIAVSATALFLTAIRGGGKVEVGTEVKQNGQFALSTIEQLVRNSQAVVACSQAAGDSISLTGRDGNNLIFACEDVGTETGRITQNGVRMTSGKVVVTSCSFTCPQAVEVGRPILVNISFILQQADAGADPAETATADFSTSVSVRSY